MYLVLLLLENINGNIEEFYTSKFSLKFNNSINLQILEKSTKLELVDYEIQKHMILLTGRRVRMEAQF